MAKDHPRSRGVYVYPIAGQCTGVGSSPLARGLRVSRGLSARLRRIIPARAGFTPMALASASTLEDHPRSRGVYAVIDQLASDEAGSSPLARGLRHAARGHHRPPGIIPARAGFTVHLGRPGEQHWDHPRSRGVYRPDLATIGARLGSSPLARGLRRNGCGHQQQDRIIPARAGFTTSVRVSLTISWDHPRSRGVYSLSACTPVSAGGSSPLARGLRECASVVR